MHALPPAMSLELARAQQADRLAAADRWRIGRDAVLARPAPRRSGRRRRSWLPSRSVSLTGRPSV